MGERDKGVLRRHNILTPEIERRMLHEIRGVTPSKFMGSSAYKPPRALTASPAEHLIAGKPAPMDPRNATLADPKTVGLLQQFMTANYPNLNVIKQLGRGVESSAFHVAPNAYTRRVTGQAGPVALKIGVTDPRAVKMTADQAKSLVPYWDLRSSKVKPWWSYQPKTVYSYLEPVTKPLGTGSTDAFKKLQMPEGYIAYESSKPHLLAKKLKLQGMDVTDLGLNDRKMMDLNKPSLERTHFLSERGPGAAQAGWVRLPGDSAEKLRIFDRGVALPQGQKPTHTAIMSKMRDAAQADVLRLWHSPEHRKTLIDHLVKTYPNAPTHDWTQKLMNMGGLSAADAKKLGKAIEEEKVRRQGLSAVPSGSAYLARVKGLLGMLLGRPASSRSS